MTNFRPTFAEIDLSAIRENIAAVRARVGPRVKIMPAVKANGYGHGAVQVSRAVLDAGAEVLCVATLEEAIQLREASVSGFRRKSRNPAQRKSRRSRADPRLLDSRCGRRTPSDRDISSTVCDLTYARAVSNAAAKQGKTAALHLKVDTGMGRIGVQPEDVIDTVTQFQSLPGLRLDGIFTHFPCADETDRTYTSSQIELFRKTWPVSSIEESRSAGSCLQQRRRPRLS